MIYTDLPFTHVIQAWSILLDSIELVILIIVNFFLEKYCHKNSSQSKQKLEQANKMYSLILNIVYGQNFVAEPKSKYFIWI